MSNELLVVRDLEKSFQVGRGVEFKAIDKVSFSIARGKTLGLVGESGCGKTTIGRTVVRLYQADGGQVLFQDMDVHRVTRKQAHELTKRMQMIFQDPYSSLNPRMTVGDIIGEGLDIHKLYNGRKARNERIYELLEMVGLNREHAGRFPHEFSGGQRQRVGIARALAVEPEFIVCDEAISALDVSIQAQIINLLMDLQDELGLTYLFIAHDLSMVRHISDDIAVMYLGNLVEKAETDTLYTKPLHPYTQGLLEAVPTPDPIYEKQREKILLTGDVKSFKGERKGCVFASRCKYAADLCQEVKPELREIEPAHFAACHRIEELNGASRRR
ncbi:ABC transporter ATP-binding protein [Paenibacillus senegalensis]|uniref:ABC transporter ATP-binding protein n=1 Tax=Paenibacillus senegalensis TaxID=1465766 RepID=UPI000287FE52|nr:ABC transporter ATP-binding protein [Paenibacillus senegalensis]